MRIKKERWIILTCICLILVGMLALGCRMQKTRTEPGAGRAVIVFVEGEQ